MPEDGTGFVAPKRPSRSPSPPTTEFVHPLLHPDGAAQHAPPARPSRCAAGCGVKALLTFSLLLNALVCAGLAAFLVLYTRVGTTPSAPPAPSPYHRPCPFDAGAAAPRLALTFQSSDALAVCWPSVRPEPRLLAPYQLLVDDWWLDSSRLRAVYAGMAKEFELTHLLPGVSYRMQVIAQPFREADVSSPIVTFSTLERPYCGNRQDLAIHQNATVNDMPGKTKACLMQTGGRHQAAVDCIVKQVGLSAGCAGCWAGEFSCIMMQCLGDCMGGADSPRCRRCIDAKCVPLVAQCAGLPLWVYNITDPAA
eukprot:EG_transcript_16407